MALIHAESARSLAAGVVLEGFFHAADWMPTILAAASAGLISKSAPKNDNALWHDVAMSTRTDGGLEPPFLLVSTSIDDRRYFAAVGMHFNKTKSGEKLPLCWFLAR